MATRARTLSGLIWEDADLARCSERARLLFIGLLNLADREGRLADVPPWIRAKLFPYEPDVDVDAALDELARDRKHSPGGFITRYSVDGRTYIEIRNFLKYQKPHPRERGSEIPPPPSDVDNLPCQGSPKVNLGASKDTPRPRLSRLGSSVPSEPSVPSDPPPGELVLTHETPADEASLPAPNPVRFVAYWQDANEHRDFGLKVEPRASFQEFLRNEAVRLEWSRGSPDFERFVNGSVERFKAHYSKRVGKKRQTRGKSLSPKRLTEELVAWIRNDLAEQQKRDAVRFKSQAERVDDSVKRLARGDGNEQWEAEDAIEPGTPSAALSGLLRDR